MIELLNSNHIRDNFNCGNEQLNRYLRQQAGQDLIRKLAVCFVLTESGSKNVIGFYTLSNYCIPRSNIPVSYIKKFPPSYNCIPTTLLGRLAIDHSLQGKGFGKIVLIDALKKCVEAAQTLGSFAVIVDPIDEKAAQFYQKYDFIKLEDSGKMFIPMKTIQALFADF